jgi:hypothetical protein
MGFFDAWPALGLPQTNGTPKFLKTRLAPHQRQFEIGRYKIDSQPKNHKAQLMNTLSF